MGDNVLAICWSDLLAEYVRNDLGIFFMSIVSMRRLWVGCSHVVGAHLYRRLLLALVGPLELGRPRQDSHLTNPGLPACSLPGCFGGFAMLDGSVNGDAPSMVQVRGVDVGRHVVGVVFGGGLLERRLAKV